MKLSLLLGLVAVCFAFTTSLHAGRFGSETRVTIEGAFRMEKPDESEDLPKGGVRVTRSYSQQEVSNATVLAALKKRGLIESTSGYSIVMVAQGHMADGIKFFAVKTGAAPVLIPSDVLFLDVADGLGQGVMQENARGRLTKLAMETLNLATLKVLNFEGTAVLEQVWSMETVTKDDTTESVQLVRSVGFFSGAISGSKDGLGLVALRLSKPKTTGLKRYGMVTTSSGSTGGTFGSTLTIMLPSYPEVTPIDIIAGNLTLGGTFSLDISNLSNNGSNFNLSDDGTLTLNTSPIGLSMAFDGASVSWFSSGTPNELTLNTADGPVVYTREASDVWSLVVPESGETGETGPVGETGPTE